MARETISWSSRDVKVHSAAERDRPLNGSGAGSKAREGGGVKEGRGEVSEDETIVDSCDCHELAFSASSETAPKDIAGGEKVKMAGLRESMVGLPVEKERVGMRGPWGRGGRPRILLEEFLG
jgi:hypothetical protein